jgi:hypothetical protein
MRLKHLLAGAVVTAGITIGLSGSAFAQQYCIPVGSPPPDPGGRICTPDLSTDPNGLLHHILCTAADNC